MQIQPKSRSAATALDLRAFFSRFGKAADGRLYFTAHSHHFWPDVTRDAQLEAWDDAARLAFAGIVVRHAELGVLIPEELRLQAIQWLQTEDISWDDPTRRKARREKELAHLQRLGAQRARPDKES